MTKQEIIQFLKDLADEPESVEHEDDREKLIMVVEQLQKEFNLVQESNGFTGLTQVMYIDPACTIKDKEEKEPLKALKRILDSEGVCYSELKNEETTEVKVENLPGVVRLLLKYFDIKGNIRDAEYFIFWEDEEGE